MLCAFSNASRAEYQNIRRATIGYAEWGFGSDGKLVGLLVFKAEDSI
jgi:hypothetical protein